MELIAVMAQYNPFAEKAGMRLIQVTAPHSSVVQAIDSLRDMGFNPVLMASVKHNQEILNQLDREPLNRILLGVNTIYYKRLARSSRPYLKKVEFKKWLNEQTNDSLARTLATLSILSQSKAYLYWCRGEGC